MAMAPAATIATGPRSVGPYSAVTTTAVTANGMTTAVIARIAVDVAHFESQIADRLTGFDATHASVPLSRSRMSRLATARIAARRKIWAEIATNRLSIGAS